MELLLLKVNSGSLDLLAAESKGDVVCGVWTVVVAAVLGNSLVTLVVGVGGA